MTSYQVPRRRCGQIITTSLSVFYAWKVHFLIFKILFAVYFCAPLYGHIAIPAVVGVVGHDGHSFDLSLVASFVVGKVISELELLVVVLLRRR